MLDKIIKFSIYNKGVIGFFTALLVIAGIYSATQLPIDAVPDITNNQVQVMTLAPTLGAQEVEQFITVPIELSLGNIPHVIEKRSISRSGISVITIVFKDATDIFWARQQISERLKEAEEQIPKGMATPMLAPITTGLGEIYHYVIHAKPGFENKYSATDLRTMQDWIVKRQLSGTEGLAEVSGWGGFVKTYEIAIDNDKINALNITIPEIYHALEVNNENTGGSYIEQYGNAYFIRGLGLVKSLEDIEKIVVKTVNDVPLLIRDIAIVQFGATTRMGAITRNGEGEAVAGVTLMLKGENFSKVISHVKERMVQIQKSLPEGVIIEPFIDRTELVGRAMGTVEKNLIEGALIVIFILVLLLGNLRAGLLVASVIPLSMLFAISMMKLFGVSGNLMSLGAIDFGLIVDGAVIIVESVVHRLHTSRQAGKDIITQKEMNETVFHSASGMMNSATFGQIIIIIVYLPILTLVGIEGKMFRPMAETVAFAIIGALLLSLTYVPMMASLVLSKSKKAEHKKNISDKIMDFLHRIYAPLLGFAMRQKIAVVIVSVALFIATIFTFTRLGGEFIPTLDEGDLTVEISMMQGASLTQVVETFGKAEKILKAKFPEIKQIVTRIGSAEIPTDPMPIERGDMMVSMKPKEEWTSAETREEMMEKMEEELSVLPGINKEITQPMQMRFNELMTGIRQDVAIKIFGDDLDTLVQRANLIAQWITPVEGVSEAIVEKVTGLPQIVVEYDRDRIAQYGLNIEDINMILKTAFAGNVAGVVFEGEKRFDMVVRLQQDLRKDISDIENLYVPLPNGKKIPLNQVAHIEYKTAPGQISHEDARRRIYVGFNVRGRDVETVVEDIQKILSEKLKLPAGYYVTYGGQFQNLKEAEKRLSLAVPAALALILVLLYLTFRSVKEMLIIFTAVPLSAIGGVYALWLRDMHFSISAGVGFIALFGVAVLNGIVLIAYFNQLEKEGVTDIYERVKKGTQVRLRPVIMTAAVASLGFLPMALSSGAGAEVQKPLATVVIGGLISATLLTLIVIPVLYILFSRRKKLKPSLASAHILFLALAVFFSTGKANAQDHQALSLDDCIKIAVENNSEMKIATLETKQFKALQKTAFDIEKTDITIMQDATDGGSSDNSWVISQRFEFPTVYTAQKKLAKAETKLSEQSAEVKHNYLIKEVKIVYYAQLYLIEKLRILQAQDSLYSDFSRIANVRFATGESSNLEKIVASNRYREIQLQKQQAEVEALINNKKLQQLLNVNYTITIAETKLPKLIENFSPDSSALASYPLLNFYRQQVTVQSVKANVEKNKFLPDIFGSYYHQYILSSFNPASIERNYFPGTRVGGFELGISIPLFFNTQRGMVQHAELGGQIAQEQLKQAELQLQTNYYAQYQNYLRLFDAINYYQGSGLPESQELLRTSQVAYINGEIGYVEFIQNTSQAAETQLRYFELLNQYNESVITLTHFTPSK
ncbi:MAG: CusA/CzcA family heavy metal efflux RND transporter [Chitinophagales bacterium]|nr:CusA/CzcA family heavy metal efflux RND transporter [Chitinophagales bacterium]